MEPLWSTMEQIELAHSIFSCWWSHKTPWPGSDPKSYLLRLLNGCTSLSLGRGPRKLYWDFEKANSQYPYLEKESYIKCMVEPGMRPTPKSNVVHYIRYISYK